MSKYKCDKCSREVCKLKGAYTNAVNTHGKYDCGEFSTIEQTQKEIDSIRAHNLGYTLKEYYEIRRF